MKLEAPINDGYAAVITSVKTITALAKRDFIVGIPVFGYQAIVPKTKEVNEEVVPYFNVGDLGVFIPAEAQLSEAFARANNMFRDHTLNADPAETGYLEPNRRIRAIRLGGHRSDAIFLPLSCLEFAGNISGLKEGDTFDTLNGVEICRKYVVKQPKSSSAKGNTPPKPRRVDSRDFPEHINTSNLRRNEHLLHEDDRLIVTQKLHGTSIRIANTKVKLKLTWKERLAKRLGVRVQETGYDMVYGSRKVTKDANDPDQNHYYTKDIWTNYGKKLNGILPEGFIVFGELIGWTEDGSPLQKGYTYDLPVGTAQLYVYRVAFINPQGLTTDLDWEAVIEFCERHGLKTVPTLAEGNASQFDFDEYLDKRFHEAGYPQAIPLGDSNKKIVDEGVCVRRDGLTPELFKHKSPIFLQHETLMLDEEAVDLEAQESEPIAA